MFIFLIELKGPVGQMIQSDNRGLLAVEKNKVKKISYYLQAVEQETSESRPLNLASVAATIT